MPTVSVIIPNYNRANLVGDTIRNMLDQSLAPSQVIVVDDGSTDHSIEVIESFGDRVTLIKQSNRGPGAARNAGLEIATGDYIQFMDSDDLASGNKFQVQVELLERTKADIAIGPWVRVNIKEERASLLDLVFQQQAPSTRIDPLTLILRGWSTVMQSLLFRHAAVRRAGSFYTDMMNGEDIEFFSRILLAGAKCDYSPDCVTLYRMNSTLKLTGDGISEATRRTDRLLYFVRIIENLERSQFHLNRWTQFLFDTSIAEILDKPSTTPESDLENQLRRQISRSNSAAISMAKSYRYWIRRARSFLKRSTYDECYKSRKITPFQRQLIEQLGFIVA